MRPDSLLNFPQFYGVGARRATLALAEVMHNQLKKL